MFAPLPAKFDFPESERRILEFWRRHDIFRKTLELRKDAPRFVFYEGPPTANGLPHPGHCLTRAMKDLFPRYQTMCGKLVERKAGWDTHGLPVEVEVCKSLGIHTKEEIEAYGVEKFVQRCIESVFTYVREWEELTRRLGFWVNLDEAYVTFHQQYVESVWWGLKTLFERGLLYQGHKVVWWWAQGGTALSAGEVGEGYRTVDDPSVFVKFPLVDGQNLPNLADGTGGDPGGDRAVSLLVWTTTPWTLISNHFAAVHPDLPYALVQDADTKEYLYIAEDLVEAIAKKIKREIRVVSICRGVDLIGLRYVPPFPEAYYARLGESTAAITRGGAEPIGWRVVAADFVTIESGTGLVHEAPAYGEVDFDLLQQERRRFEDPDAIPLLNAVNPDGTFNDDAPAPYRGRWVKDCDKEIIRELKERTTPWGTPLLFHQEQYRHEYPFCPRAENDPLIQYARKSWFVRTSRFKDEFLANNARINWLPEHIREGRFGDFLRNNVDWALSRERYWGTPLPIWVCEQTGKMEAIGSFDELRAKPGATDASPEYPEGFWATKAREAEAAGHPLPEHLRVHKPYIDHWTYDSPFAEGDGQARPRMHRVPEVIDCWWDAGSMPFAQWGYPHAPGSEDTFAARFPADFISEAIDQTRGWFYGLLAINTLLFTGDQAPVRRDYPLPYRTCIVLGHMMGEDGLKMSKRTKNYKEPGYVFDTLGADAMRWYFFSAQTPWTSVRFQEAAIRDAQREMLVRLYNVFSFFNIYANIDGFSVAGEKPQASASAASHTDDGVAVENPRGSKPTAKPTGYRPAAERPEIDRWILSELHITIREMRAALDRFENYPAAQKLTAFVDALSNWYVRRCRDRFWRGIEGGDSDRDQDKWDAYNTLYECLTTLSRLIAPFTPFFAETMYQNLEGWAGLPDQRAEGQRDSGDEAANLPEPLSVHMCDYPMPDAALIDETLAEEMDLVRDIASLGLAARAQAKLRVRQPLARVEIILARPEHEQWLSRHANLIAEELNVKEVEFTAHADHYVEYEVKPNFKAIGPKHGKLAPKIAGVLKQLPDPGAARRDLTASGTLRIEVDGRTVELSGDDVEIRLAAKPGWSAAQGRAGVVVLNTELTDELREEGMIRELIHHVQALRKARQLEYEARIRLTIAAEPAFAEIIRRWESMLRSECLAEKVEYGSAAAGGESVSIDGEAVRLSLAVAGE